MHLKTNVKFGGVRNLSDARYAASIGVNFVGFDFDSHDDLTLSTTDAKEMMGWLEGPTLVGEFGNKDASEIHSVMEALDLKYLQFNDYYPELQSEFSNCCIIQNIILKPGDTESTLISQIDAAQKSTNYFMLSFNDEDAQGAFFQERHSELVLLDLCRDYPVFLNFHFNTTNLELILTKYNPFGINFRGSNEESIGLKDFEDINELLPLLEK